MSRLKVMYWFDIPGQVIVKSGRRSQRYRLSARFFNAIQRAGYRVKKQGVDPLFDPWREVDFPLSADDAQAAARQVVWRLESEYDELRLERLVRSGGQEKVPEQSPVDF